MLDDEYVKGVHICVNPDHLVYTITSEKYKWCTKCSAKFKTKPT